MLTVRDTFWLGGSDVAEFKDRLKALREQQGMSQRELAAALGLSAGAIGMYESGQRTPDFNTLKRMAALLHTSTDYLLGLTDDPRPADEAKQDDPAPTLEDLRRMAMMIEASGGHIDAAMARVIREILEAANRGKAQIGQGAPPAEDADEHGEQAPTGK